MEENIIMVRYFHTVGDIFKSRYGEEKDLYLPDASIEKQD